MKHFFNIFSLILLSVSCFAQGTDKPENSISGSTGNVMVVLHSPSGKMLVSGSNTGEIIIYDPQTFTEQKRLKSEQPITSLSFSKDEQFLISGGGNGQAILWNIANGESITRISNHLAAVTGVALTADAKYIVTTGEDGKLNLYDRTINGKFIKGIVETVPSKSLALTADGKKVYTGGDDGKIRIYSLPTLAIIKTLEGHTSVVNAVSLSPDGRYLVSSSFDKNIILWDTKNDTMIKKFTGHTWKVYDVKFSINSQFLVSSSNDGSIRLWDVQAGTLLKTIMPQVRENYFAASLSFDATSVIVGTPVKDPSDAGLLVFKTGLMASVPSLQINNKKP